MKKMMIVAAILLGCVSMPAHAFDSEQIRSMKVDPPICERTTVKAITHAGPDEGNGNFRCGACASTIDFADGRGQYGAYAFVPGIEHSRVGDSVRLCLVSVFVGCPVGDDRSQVYRATNLRTHETWEVPEHEHTCGGA
jgi:hypothetical protein